MELLLLAPLLGWMLILGRLLAVRPAPALVFAVSAIVLIMYLAGLAGVLPAARIGILVAGLLMLATELIRHRGQSVTRLTAVPVLLWLALAVLYFILHGDGHFRFYDEYSHWGIHLKEMLALGGFWDASSNSLHSRYPPGPTLWQYLFFVARPFNDGLAYFAQFLLLITPLMLLADTAGMRQSIDHADSIGGPRKVISPGLTSVLWIAAITILILLSLASFGHGIASLYVDHVLGAWVAGVLLLVLSNPETPRVNRHLSLLLPLAVLALIKDVGFFFAIALAFILALVLFSRTSSAEKTGVRLRGPTVLALAWIAGVLLVTLAWTANRNAVEAPADVMSVAGLAGIVTGSTRFDDPERATLVRNRFARVFLHHPLTKNEASYRFNESSYQTMSDLGGGGRLTTAGFLLFFVLGGGAILLLAVPPKRRAEFGIVYACLLGLAAGYLLMLYLSYQYVFPRRDGLRIASYVRYAHSMALPMWLLLLAPLLPLVRQESNNETPRRTLMRPALLALALGALLVVEKPYLTPLYRPVAMPAFRADVQPFAQLVQAIAGRAPVWVLFPEPSEHRLLSSILRHELTPTPARISNDPEVLVRSASLAEALQGFAYAWIVVDSAATEAAVRRLAGQPSPISLYAVQAGPGGPALVALGPEGNPLSN